MQNPLGKLLEEKRAASYVASSLVNQTAGRSGYWVYLITVGKSELLETKNKAKPFNSSTLVTAANSSPWKAVPRAVAFKESFHISPKVFLKGFLSSQALHLRGRL